MTWVGFRPWMADGNVVDGLCDASHREIGGILVLRAWHVSSGVADLRRTGRPIATAEQTASFVD